MPRAEHDEITNPLREDVSIERPTTTLEQEESDRINLIVVRVAPESGISSSRFQTRDSPCPKTFNLGKLMRLPKREVPDGVKGRMKTARLALARVNFASAMRELETDYPFEGRIRPESGELEDIASTVLTWLNPPAKLLDFGAGACLVTGLLSILGFDCSACDDMGDPWAAVEDNREKAFAFARRRHIRFVVTERNGRLPFAAREFDALILNDVLEHLHDSPKGLLTELVKLVKSGGFIFLTVPNAVNLLKRARVLAGKTNMPSFESYYWFPGPWRGHVREYTKDDLVLLCKFLDLRIMTLKGVHHHLHVIPRELRPIWLVLTSLVKGGRDTWSLVARKGDDWSPRELSKEEIDAILARAAHWRTGH